MNFLIALKGQHLDLLLFILGLAPYIFIARKLVVNRLNQSLRLFPHYNAIEKQGVAKWLFYCVVNFYFLAWNALSGDNIPPGSRLALIKNVALAITTALSTIMLINAVTKASQRLVPKAHSNLLLGIQAIRMLSYFTVAALTAHYVFNTSISSLVTSVGVTTGVVLVLFRDTILGMIASLQAVLTDSLRIGDHVYLKQYDIDGTMEYISPFMIRIRHWDGSASTLHSYALVSGSMKNFRDRHTARKRRARIKVPIATSAIKPAEPELVSKVKQLAKPLLKKEIEGLTEGPTNLELFKAFVKAYMHSIPSVKGASLHYLDDTDQSIILNISFVTNHMDVKQYETVRSQIIENIFLVANQVNLSN